MRVSLPWRRACALLALPVLLLLVSCSPGNTAISPAEQALTALPKASPPAQPVPETATSCNQLPELAGGQSTQMYALNFPWEGLAVATITTPTSAPMQVAAYVICLPFSPASGTPTPAGTAMDQVITVLGFFERGWVISKVFPADGEKLSQCTSDQQCFQADPQTYVLLEQARSNNNGLVVVDLRMALPQPIVPCDPVLFPIYTYPNAVNPYWAASIPLPPGTRFSQGRGTEEGISMFFCSAGTAKEVNDYMKANLPKAGWKSVQVNGVQLWTIQTQGAPRLYMRLYPITDPRKWSELEYFDSFTP